MDSLYIKGLYLENNQPSKLLPESDEIMQLYAVTLIQHRVTGLGSVNRCTIHVQSKSDLREVEPKLLYPLFAEDKDLESGEFDSGDLYFNEDNEEIKVKKIDHVIDWEMSLPKIQAALKSE